MSIYPAQKLYPAQNYNNNEKITHMIWVDIPPSRYASDQKGHEKMLNITGKCHWEMQIKTIMRHHFVPTRIEWLQLNIYYYILYI